MLSLSQTQANKNKTHKEI